MVGSGVRRDFVGELDADDIPGSGTDLNDAYAVECAGVEPGPAGRTLPGVSVHSGLWNAGRFNCPA